MRNRWIYGIIILAGVMITSCGNPPRDPNQQGEKEKQEKALEQAFIDANKRAVAEEEHMIEKYIERHQWKMNRISSGFYYGIYHSGKGRQVSKGSTVSMDYTIELLNGYPCYSSQSHGKPKTFTVGQGDATPGIHRVMPHLQGGDKAKVIIPSFLAYGTAGDKKEIPPKSTLVYDIHLLKVHQP